VKLHGRELEAPFVLVTTENVIVPDGQVEEIAGSDARRILVIVRRPWGWDAD
jgi:hypothetical protein